MGSTNETTKNKSLGYLYRNTKTTLRSPELVGKINLRVDTLKDICGELHKSGRDAIECQIAAWANRDKNGQQYLTIQLSLPYVRSIPQPEPKVTFDLSDFIGDEPEDCE